MEKICQAPYANFFEKADSVAWDRPRAGHHRLAFMIRNGLPDMYVPRVWVGQVVVAQVV